MVMAYMRLPLPGNSLRIPVFLLSRWSHLLSVGAKYLMKHPIASYICESLIYYLCNFLYRFGEPDDCAGAVAYLTSDDAAYVTGETIAIAGGMQTRL